MSVCAVCGCVHTCAVCGCVHMSVGVHVPLLPVWRLEEDLWSPALTLCLILLRQVLSLNLEACHFLTRLNGCQALANLLFLPTRAGAMGIQGHTWLYMGAEGQGIGCHVCAAVLI